jgi:GH43 family beta-xylosidase
MRAAGTPFLARPRTDVADPFVLEADGSYFLYHTGHETGIPVYRSDDLISWSHVGLALSPDPRLAWAACDFWAPEVVFRDGRFFMYVAVASTLPNGSPDDEQRRLAVAHADNPIGPFELYDQPLIGDEWAIDAHPFQDADGSWWLFYNARSDETRYPDGTIGCANAVVELPSPQQVYGEHRIIVKPTERWEGNADGTWYWNEGAFVVRRGKKLLQTYSGGWFADGTYAIGTATADFPSGQWSKNPGNPLLVSSDRVVGPGHNCIVTGPDGFTSFLVYHAHMDGEQDRSAYMAEFHWVGDGFAVTGPSPAQPGRGGYHPDIPHRISNEAVDTAHPARLTIRSTRDGVRGELNGRPVRLSLGTVEECLDALAEQATYVRVRSGVNEATEVELAGGEEMVIPWAPEVATTVNVVVAGPARVSFGDDVLEGSSEAPRLVRIDSDKGGAELRISADGPVSVTGIEMVPKNLSAQRPGGRRPPSPRDDST